MEGKKLVGYVELGEEIEHIVTKLHEIGFNFDLSPPSLITGDNMVVTDSGVEALIVPLQLPQGKLEINVAVRERA